MSAPRRENDPRRVAKTIQDHQNLMKALGDAVNFNRLGDDRKGTHNLRDVSVAVPKFKVEKNEHGLDEPVSLSNQEEFIPGAAHVRPLNRGMSTGFEGVSKRYGEK